MKQRILALLAKAPNKTVFDPPIKLQKTPHTQALLIEDISMVKELWFVTISIGDDKCRKCIDDLDALQLNSLLIRLNTLYGKAK